MNKYKLLGTDPRVLVTDYKGSPWYSDRIISPTTTTGTCAPSTSVFTSLPGSTVSPTSVWMSDLDAQDTGEADIQRLDRLLEEEGCVRKIHRYLP